MTPQEIAKSIADELRAHPERWRKDGKYGRRETNRHCIAQHIAKRLGFDCADGGYQSADETGVFQSFEALALGSEFRSLMSWNDDPARSVADVIELCDKVAAS